MKNKNMIKIIREKNITVIKDKDGNVITDRKEILSYSKILRRAM